MKRLFSFLMVLVAILVIAPTTKAQTTNVGTHTVQPGETLYVLKGIYSETQPEWRALRIANPFLAEPGRAFRDPENRFIVVIKPGETIDGADQLNVTPEVLVKNIALAPATYTEKASSLWNNTGWWIFLAVLLLLVAWFVIGEIRGYRDRRDTLRAEREAEEERRQEEIRRREALNTEMNRPVETAGSPMVQGGLRPDNTEVVRNFFHQQAAAQFRERQPNYPDPAARPTQLGDIEHGMLGLAGEVGQVRDINGNWHPRRLDGPKPGYQARFSYPDGTEEVMQAFEICMNIVRRGEGMRGFTFVSNRVVGPAPQPATTATHPHAALQLVRHEAGERRLTTYTTPKGDTLIFEEGCQFSHDAKNQQILRVASSGGVRIDVRMDEMQAAATVGPQAVETAATGTDGAKS
jgi:hypothetical protein